MTNANSPKKDKIVSVLENMFTPCSPIRGGNNDVNSSLDLDDVFAAIHNKVQSIDRESSFEENAVEMLSKETAKENGREAKEKEWWEPGTPREPPAKKQATYAGGRKTRNSSGTADHNGPRVSALNGNPKKKTERQPHANEDIFERLMEQADFEVNHDPYRGMLRLENGDDTHCLWKECQFVKSGFRNHRDRNTELILNIENAAKNDLDASQLSRAWVEEVCHCHCPSLIGWTQEAIMKERNAAKKKKSKKRKQTNNESHSSTAPPRVGQRPNDLNYRCPCDYNPFCTSSLGGICNEIWQERAQNLFEKRKREHENLEALIKAQQRSDWRERHPGAGSPENVLIESNSEVPSEMDAKQNGNKRGYEEIEIVESDFKKTAKSQCVGDSKEDDAAVMDLCEDDDSKNYDSLSNHTATVFPEEISYGVDSDMEYSPQTMTQLKNLRPCAMVQVQPIREYLESLLHTLPQNSTNVATVDDLLNRYIKWQQSLVFSNPLQDRLKPSDSVLPIALPPGILNLGATCYLNTQLQCLAQNKIFLEGIISWRKTEAASAATDDDANDHHNAMNSVLTHLQSLLARMVEGPARTINTMEFSAALGLEHDEQQDPNEFARLLFELLHNSFQRHPGLANLLPSLFEGVTTYITTCSHCKTKSVRKEKFMDLNLPIVQPPKEDDGEKENGKEGSFGNKIYHFFSKCMGGSDDTAETKLPNAHADTDLQYCLDQYSIVEALEGDNQYHCSTCGCKRDATRETALGSLPPVLNVQLSRYVFDRATLMKKKLTDKVLLPRKLLVQTKQSDSAGDTSRTETYVLCAVMKHLGSSAYRGHYIAESMDFLTGQWFEYNDEKVKILERGPSCSYIPFHLNASYDIAMEEPGDQVARQATDKTRVPKLTGSSDAYNMYYVEEKFLAQTVLKSYETLRKRQLGKKGIDRAGILGNIASEREAHFKDLGELCIADGYAAERLRSRRKQLRAKMFSVASNAATHEDNGNERASPVWVDAELLRRFVSCKDRLDDLFRTAKGEPLLRHKHLLCHHRSPGLHPRIARRGKLLPASMYASYEHLLAAERCLYLGEDMQSPCESDRKDEKKEKLYSNLNDCLITPENNLHCHECAILYGREIQEKLKMARLLKQLYINLDPNSNTGEYSISGLDGDDSEYYSEDEGDRYAYIVARKSITAFRKEIQDFMSKIIGDASGTSVNSRASSAIALDEGNGMEDTALSVKSASKDSLAEGLDAIDFSKLRYNEDDQEDIGKDIDVKLNSKIICPHGNCVCSFSKQSVRWLKSDVWAALKEFFPQAIELKIDRYQDAGEDAASKCNQCQQEVDSKEEMAKRLEAWYDETLSRGSQALKSLVKDDDRNSTQKTLAAAENSGDALEFTFLCHSDVILWRQIVDKIAKLMRRTGKNKNSCRTGKEIRELLDSRRSDWSAYTEKRLEEGFLRPLTCERHGLTFKIFFKKEATDCYELSLGVQMLTRVQYTGLVASITDMIKILADKDDVIDLSEDHPRNPDLKRDSLLIPFVKTGSQGGYKDCETIMVRVPDQPNSAIQLRLYPKMCTDESCCHEFQEIERAEAESQSASQSGRGSAASDPIVVESETEEANATFSLKVYEVEPGASTDEALSALMELNVIQISGAIVDSNDDMVGFPRRSSRKRKLRFPTGKILGEDAVKIAMHHNLAALRLFLYQNELPIDQKLILVLKAPASHEEMNVSEKACAAEGGSCPSDDTKPMQYEEPRLEELSLDNNKETLEEIYCRMTDGTDPEFERLGDPAKNLILLRQTDKSGSGFEEMELMDALLETSNSIADDKSQEGNNKKKPAERGFRGTLLSRGTPAAPKPNGRDSSSDVEEGRGSDSATSVPEKNATAHVESHSEKKAELSNDSIADANSPNCALDDSKRQDAGDTANKIETLDTPSCPRRSERLGSVSKEVFMVVENVKRRSIVPVDTQNEELWMQAAHWAVENHSGSESSVESITNACIAKYLEFTT